MKFNLSIGQKLGLGFGVLLLAIIANGIISYQTLTNTKAKNERVSKIYTPSKGYLKDLKTIVERSGNLTISWLAEVDHNIPDKKELIRLHEHDYVETVQALDLLIEQWEYDDQKEIRKVRLSIDSLFEKEHQIIKVFKDSKSYFVPSSNLKMRYDLIESFQLSKGKYNNRIKQISKKIAEQVSKQTRLANQYTDEMENEFDKLQDYITYLSLFLVAMGLLTGYVTSSSIVVPLAILKEKLNVLGQGKLPEKREKYSADEIGLMSQALNKLIDGLKATSMFAKAIGDKRFNADFQPLSSEDTLGNSLLLMRDNLVRISEEDRRRNWTTSGLARFGEILRHNSDNVNALANSLISDLVKYLNANQGGVFVLSTSDEALYSQEFMELVGCYAWDRTKYLEQKIGEGDGLVGQVWQERHHIYITDIPDNYIKIISGLGTANPKSILIVPMIFNDKIYGVIEIASFNELEPYQIDFVNKVAETTASSISSVKVNQRTKNLLEKTQKATERLRSQEELMRKKQEELGSTQEELKLKVSEMQERLHKVDFERNELKEENEILQNILLKTSKDLERLKAED